MARYIDADDLLREFSAGGMPIQEKGISGLVGDTSCIKDYIDAAPSEDVALVIHGSWIYQEPDDAYTYKPWKCSNCGLNGGKHQTAYCPHCGAKMDKK